MSWAISDDLALAQRLADAAGEVTLGFWRRNPTHWTKTDGSLATEADVATEARICALLRAERPGDTVLGEESGALGAGTRRWILDGIDATVEFAAGTEQWGTLIALEVDGVVVLGMAVAPARRRRTWAVLGGGAFESVDGGPPVRLAVSDATELPKALTWLPQPAWIPDAAAERMADAMRASTVTPAWCYHPAFEVAAGRGDAAVFFTGGVWDIAAPALIVTEAGGRFTSVSGEPGIDRGTAVYTNGRLHAGVLRVLANAAP